MVLAARVWFALTAVAGLLGVVIQLASSDSYGGGSLTSLTGWGRVLMSFAVLASLLAAGSGAWLTKAGAGELLEASVLWDTVRLSALVSVVLAAVAFHAGFDGLQDLHAKTTLATLLLHIVTPLLCVLGWLLFGPRGRFQFEALLWSVVGLVSWLVFTLARGVGGEVYPYDALNASELGYPRVLLTCALAVVAFTALAWAVLRLDARLPAPFAAEADDAAEPANSRA